MPDKMQAKAMKLQFALTGTPYQMVIDALTAEFSEDTLTIIAKAISPNEPTIDDWIAAVKRSYFGSVTNEEYVEKATDTAIRRVALYMETHYGPETLPLFDDTCDEAPNTEVQFLFDFIASEA